jgi:hypothetical protein
MTPDSPSYRRLFAATLACFAGLLVWYFLNARSRIGGEMADFGHSTGDFGHFYYGAKAMLEHQDIYASWHHGYIYPPLLAFLFMPLALLPENAAAYILLLLNMAMVAATAALLAREFLRRLDAPGDRLTVAVIALLGLLLMADKTKSELQMWQTNALMLLMFALALRWLDRRPWLAGLALGLAFNIKYLPIVMLPYLLMRRRWTAAGAFAAGIVLFAILPAVYTGFGQNIHDLGVAFAGLGRLIGVQPEPGAAANIHDVDVGFSLSITSGLVRVFGRERLGLAYACAAVVAGAGVTVAAWMYRRHGVPLLAWPDREHQYEQPYRAVVALEWAGLTAFVLVFSPQTNPRHLYMLLIVQVLAAVLLLVPRRGVPRWPLVAGTVVLAIGLNLPPGGAGFNAQVRWWHGVAGPSWCVLVMYATVLWTGLCYARTLREVAPLADPPRAGRARLKTAARV